MSVRTVTRPILDAIRRDGRASFTGRPAGVWMELPGDGPVLVGWGSPSYYPEHWVVVSEPYPRPAGSDLVLIAPQELYLEWKLNPDGNPYPPGSRPAPITSVEVEDE